MRRKFYRAASWNKPAIKGGLRKKPKEEGRCFGKGVNPFIKCPERYKENPGRAPRIRPSEAMYS